MCTLRKIAQIHLDVSTSTYNCEKPNFPYASQSSTIRVQTAHVQVLTKFLQQANINTVEAIFQDTHQGWLACRVPEALRILCQRILRVTEDLRAQRRNTQQTQPITSRISFLVSLLVLHRIFRQSTDSMVPLKITSALRPIARSLVSANHKLRSIETDTFLWSLTLASPNQASSNSGLVLKTCVILKLFQTSIPTGPCDLQPLRTSLACAFCFPISDHVMFSWESSLCLFKRHAQVHKTNMHVHKTTFERNYSQE